MPDVVTVGQASNAAVVTCGQNDSVANNDGTYVLTIAGGPSGDDPGNGHKVVVPSGSLRPCHDAAAIPRRPRKFPAARCGWAPTSWPPTLEYLTGWRCRGYLPSVKTRFDATLTSFGLALALLVSGSATRAQGVPNSDQLLVQIAALEKPVAQAALLKQPLDAARSALNRARDARAAGDVEHGIELEALAQDYVMIARDVLHATALEAALSKSQAEFHTTETSRRQTETLLEATIAQRERSKAQLLQWHAEHDAKKAAPSVKPDSGKANKGAKK